jgi:hypothetical protein
MLDETRQVALMDGHDQPLGGISKPDSNITAITDLFTAWFHIRLGRRPEAVTLESMAGR